MSSFLHATATDCLIKVSCPRRLHIVKEEQDITISTTIVKNMSSRSGTSHVGHTGIELERIFRISKAATAYSTPLNVADFATPFARVSIIDDPWRDDLDLMSEKVVDEHRKDKQQH